MAGTEAALPCNCPDRDGDSLTARLLKATKYGNLKLKASGAFTYKPQQGFAGKDKFTYEVVDGKGASATAKVKLKVQPA